MKKIFSFALLLPLMAVLSVSCDKVKGEGEVVSETRSVTNYTGISLSLDGEVYYTPDTVYSLQISAQQAVLDVIENPVENGRLVLKYKSGKVIGPHETVVVHVRAPSLGSFVVNGSGNIHCDPLWPVSRVDLDISGSGNLYLNQITANDVYANISGSGNMEVTRGSAGYAQYKISGSGRMNFSGMPVDTAYAIISGSGNMDINVLKLLDATISGSGNIGYYGTPAVNLHISGSGNVRKL
ncbi:MAG: head GIN domain-containing protein [Syntrophothermus sp.]